MRPRCILIHLLFSLLTTAHSKKHKIGQPKQLYSWKNALPGDKLMALKNPPVTERYPRYAKKQKPYKYKNFEEHDKISRQFSRPALQYGHEQNTRTYPILSKTPKPNQIRLRTRSRNRPTSDRFKLPLARREPTKDRKFPPYLRLRGDKLDRLNSYSTINLKMTSLTNKVNTNTNDISELKKDLIEVTSGYFQNFTDFDKRLKAVSEELSYCLEGPEVEVKVDDFLEGISDHRNQTEQEAPERDENMNLGPPQTVVDGLPGEYLIYHPPQVFHKLEPLLWSPIEKNLSNKKNILGATL